MIDGTLYEHMQRKGACPGFVWQGQPFDHCERDGCGLPFWEHSHHETRGFREKDNKWVYKRRVIQPCAARTAKRKWEGWLPVG